MYLRGGVASGCLAVFALAAPSYAKPPLEAFGDVPQVRSMELSPDGKKVAFLQRQNGGDLLLIHGASDTVAPIRQSNMMHDALKGAQKSVQLIRIPGDDHSLVDNASRRQVLTALADFLRANIGSKPD